MSRTAKVLISAVVMVVLSALLAGAVAAKPSGPGPGNSPNTKLCHKGGWENLADANGNGFANQDECVAYAAQGGVLQPKPEGEADLTLSPGTPTGAQNPNAYTYNWDANDAIRTFTVENMGGATSDPLVVLGGIGGGQFSVGIDNCTGQAALAPGETCTFDISFVNKGDCFTAEPFGVIGPLGPTAYISLEVRPPSCPV